ncbi:hypothetical protein NLG97_g1982 [Lecanicillium saksenae]|uniref:Uncharacterized protein n=1 Tax=Lecanicillium saksenae TaxID=468837 RepID=A0ACC1R686_9HYPO|nr:hypothetical protein NLG97_g1982 [Lecanicillium saksenae]
MGEAKATLMSHSLQGFVAMHNPSNTLSDNSKGAIGTENSQRAAGAMETVVQVDGDGAGFAMNNGEKRRGSHRDPSSSRQKGNATSIGAGARVSGVVATEAAATLIPDTQAQPQLRNLGRKTVPGPFNVPDTDGQGVLAKLTMDAGAPMSTRRGQRNAAGPPGGTSVDASSDMWRPRLAGSRFLRKVPPIKVISRTLKRQDGERNQRDSRPSDDTESNTARTFRPSRIKSFLSAVKDDISESDADDSGPSESLSNRRNTALHPNEAAKSGYWEDWNDDAVADCLLRMRQPKAREGGCGSVDGTGSLRCVDADGEAAVTQSADADDLDHIRNSDSETSHKDTDTDATINIEPRQAPGKKRKRWDGKAAPRKRAETQNAQKKWDANAAFRVIPVQVERSDRGDSDRSLVMPGAHQLPPTQPECDNSSTQENTPTRAASRMDWPNNEWRDEPGVMYDSAHEAEVPAPTNKSRHNAKKSSRFRSSTGHIQISPAIGGRPVKLYVVGRWTISVLPRRSNR